MLNNERWSTALGYCLVTVMLICAVKPVLDLAQRIAPWYDGAYLLGAAGIAALEALLSGRMARRLPTLGPEWIAFRLAELVVLTLGLRLWVYAQHGFDTFWLDLQQWSADPGRLFRGEFLFALIVTGSIWGLASYFGALLSDLEGDADLAAREQGVMVFSDRAGARRRLITETFLIGGFMLVVTAAVRNELSFFGVQTPVVDTGLANVVVYFVLSLILLAQSQFAVLRAQWGLNGVAMEHNLSPRWAVYSLLLLAMSASAVVFLPTRYSMGFLDSLRFALGAGQYILYLILFLLWLPVMFLLKLLGQGAQAPGQLPPLAPLQPPAQAAGVTLPWWESLQSVLFWAVLLLVVTGSILYYLRQHSELAAALRRWPALAWLARLLEWLAGTAERAGRGAQRVWKAFTARTQQTPVRPPWTFIRLRRLPPRELIRFYYLALVQRAGIQRQPAQTPREFQASLGHLPAQDVGGLTDSFLEARYSAHAISAQDAGRARGFWENIRRAVRAAHRLAGPKRDL